MVPLLPIVNLDVAVYRQGIAEEILQGTHTHMHFQCSEMDTQ